MNERSRGLTAKGEVGTRRITERLRQEGINAFYSSPYIRAIQTISGLAEQLGAEINSVEDLREIHCTGGDKSMPDQDLYPLLIRMSEDLEFIPDGGESMNDCQKRSVRVLKKIMDKHSGHKIVIGTHGTVMTLMMNYFDAKYDLNFLLQTTKPDIYRMKLSNGTLMDVERMQLVDPIIQE